MKANGTHTLCPQRWTGRLGQSLKALLSAIGLVLSLTVTEAATFSMSWKASTAPMIDDPAYSDVESVQFTSADNQTSITGSFYGRGYGQDPLSTDRWGLLDNSLEWNGGQSGWLIRQGFAPDMVASTRKTVLERGVTFTIPASYLEIQLQPPPDLIFTQVSLSIQKPTDVDFATTAWGSASTSDGALATTAVSITGNRNNKTATWAFSTLSGGAMAGQPLTLRLYGVLGADSGTFNTLSVSGQTGVPTVVVPEPAWAVMIGLGAFSLIFRRRI